MKRVFSLAIITTVFLQFSSCKPAPKKEIDTKAKEVVVEKKSSTREPTDDEIREYGIIKSIVDGQYPMFIVTVEFPKRQTKTDFSLNVEAISQTVSGLDSLIDTSVSFYYEDTSDNMLMDIHFKNKTLYGEYAPEIDASFKKITGILSGAESETAGDLPNTIYITDTKGYKMAFKEFITAEIVAKNGKTVTGYYYMKYNQTITYIKKSED